MRIEDYHDLTRIGDAPYITSPFCPLAERYFMDLFRDVGRNATIEEDGSIVMGRKGVLGKVGYGNIGWEDGRIWYDDPEEQQPFEGLYVLKNSEGTAILGNPTALVMHKGNLFLARIADEDDPTGLDFVIGRPVRKSARRNYYTELKSGFQTLKTRLAGSGKTF